MSEKKKASSDDPMVAALLRERDAYARTGRTDRIPEVDRQLSLRGYTPADEDEPGKAGGEDETRSEPPKGRATRQSRQEKT